MERSKAVASTAKHRTRLRDRYRLPISTQQRETQRDPGHLGLPLWTSQIAFRRHSFSSNDNNLLQSLLKIIERLGEGNENFEIREVRDVQGDWLGWRQRTDVNKGELAAMGERARYEGMMGDVRSELTIFFVHGGAFYYFPVKPDTSQHTNHHPPLPHSLGNSATSRSVLANLVRLTGSRGFAVHYRLSPQHPFPAPLLDILVAYLSLLHPSSTSFHEPVPASNIVFAGESSGANLCFAVLQSILELGRLQERSVPLVTFHGEEVGLPVPAGLASVCGMLDLTRSLASWTREDEDDLYGQGPGPYLAADFPKDEVWPTTPPRGEINCDVSALCHPLVSHTAANDWRGSPPLFVCVGRRG